MRGPATLTTRKGSRRSASPTNIEVLELIINLLAECANFMPVFDIYTKVESKELYRLVCDTLYMLADVCDLLVTLRKRDEKVKVALKQGISGKDRDFSRPSSRLTPTAR